MLTTLWYTAASAHPSTGYNSIIHQTAGQMSDSNTPSSVLNMSFIGGNTGKRGNAASSSMALFKNTIVTKKSTRTRSLNINNQKCKIKQV